MVGWQNVQFRSQRAKVQRADLCVLRCASARACGRRSFQKHVSRQQMRQLSGVARESLAHSHEQPILTMGVCFVVFRTKKCHGLLVYSCCVCSLDRTVLLLAVCERMGAIERDVSRVTRQKHTCFWLLNDRS